MTEKASARLGCKDVDVQFADNVVLRNAALSVSSGEIVAIVGRNGAGKTTLLRVLAGLQTPARGAVTLTSGNSKAPTALAGIARRVLARRIAFLPQRVESTPGQTVDAFVLLGRYAHRSPWKRFGTEDQEKVGAALSQMDLDSLRSRRLGTLSGGERQRVVLARAMAQDADFILLDEPANNLDPSHQWRTLEALQNMASRGRGIVLVMHDLQLACRYAHRTALVHESAVELGPTSQVMTRDAIKRVFGMEAEVSFEAQRPRIDLIRGSAD